MPRITMFLPSLGVLALAVGLGGCAGEAPSPTPPPVQETSGAGTGAAEQSQPMEEGSGQAEHEGQGEASEGLAQLSEADRALAEKQKVCPVSGEALGSEGKPYKVTVEGRDVFLCCKACEAEIKANPEKYLAKLSQ